MTQLSDRMTQVSDPGHARPRYSLSQAAQMTGVSLSTMKRKRAAGLFPNAEQGEQGAWLVPVEDLLAAGLHLNRSMVTQVRPVMAQVSDLGQTPVTQVNDPGQTELARLGAELAEYRRRAEVAEARLEERAEVVAALKMALRQLEAAPGPVVEDPGAEQSTEPEPAEPSPPVVQTPAESVHTSGITPPAKPRTLLGRLLGRR